jgi:5-formyltetrahydrofolate cyclo-ligase
MQLTIQAAKRALRSQIRAQLKQMTSEERFESSAKLRDRLESQDVWKNAESILFFAPMDGEVDIWPSMVAALAAALPRFVEATGSYIACQVQHLPTDVALGRFGIREPKDQCSKLSLNRLDFILVPGVAFDLHGGRLGRGRGFYDALLATASGRTCGVAFDNQIVSVIPVEPHDAYVNCILTPTRWLEI